jgi:predicted PolB exonuclease-like 3'-5' exonuclease
VRILLFDIETIPNLAYVWGKYEQDVVEFTREWYILCFAYKWLEEKKVTTHAIWDFRTYKKDKENDKELCRKLWELFDQADIIIAHNGNTFDIKKANARFLVHNLPAPSPYKSIDTKLVAKRYFNFNGNSLNDLGQTLKLGKKIQTGGFELWKGCMFGDKNAWKKMIKYNKHDVLLLEKVYLKMKSWMDNHPNIGLLNGDKRACPNCGSNNVKKRGFNYSRITSYQRYYCKTCGAWSRGEIIKTKGVQIR